MKGLVIGDGEVGIALHKVLNTYYQTDIRGEEEPNWNKTKFDIIHICFPYSDDFKKEVKKYQDKYNPDYTVIHSTVPVGTSSSLSAIHSPVRGIHPNLATAIQTFVKYLGGEEAHEVADYFRRAGIKVYIFDKAETTELMKILSTTKYGVDIEFTKEVKRLCDKHNVPFEAWTLFTDSYNDGYSKMDLKEYRRPNLVPIMKEIGGKCVLPNTKLLKSKFTKLLQKLNGNL